MVMWQRLWACALMALPDRAVICIGSASRPPGMPGCCRGRLLHGWVSSLYWCAAERQLPGAVLAAPALVPLWRAVSRRGCDELRACRTRAGRAGGAAVGGLGARAGRPAARAHPGEGICGSRAGARPRAAARALAPGRRRGAAGRAFLPGSQRAVPGRHVHRRAVAVRAVGRLLPAGGRRPRAPGRPAPAAPAAALGARRARRAPHC